MKFKRNQLALAAMGNMSAPTLQPSLGFDFTQGTIVPRVNSSIVPTFTRATTKTMMNWEGRIELLLSGEVPFDGLRRVRNLVLDTENLTSANWSSLALGTGSAASATAGFTDPLGGTTAFRVQANKGAGVTSGDYSYWVNAPVTFPSGSSIRGSMWIKSNTGLPQNVSLRLTGADAAATVVATATWQRVTWSGVYAANGPTTHTSIGARAAQGDATIDVLVWRPMLEDMTGQSNQNPSEYVSVGALSSPYHGSNVDGVKCFRTLNGNTVSGNVVTEATGETIPKEGKGIGWLPGTNGSHYTTPDAAANRITGDLWCAVYVAADQYTPGASTYLGGKYDTVGNQRSWLFQLTAAGGLGFTQSLDGTATTSYSSSVVHGIANFTGCWFAFFRVAATGAITFWTSPDGVTWTQLGAQVATTAGNLFNSTAPVSVGGFATGGGPATRGSYYRMKLATSFNGTAVVDFDPNDWVSGASWTSSRTGEVWTLLNGAKVNRWPVMGYFSEVQSTNLVLQSEDFSTTWTAIGTPTRVAAALRCGTVKLDLIGDDDPAVLEGYSQPVTYTADGIKSFSIFFAQGTSTSSVVEVFDSTGGVSRALFVITWTNGIPTVTAINGTVITGRTGQSGWEPDGNGVFRLIGLTTAVTAANVNNYRAFPATDSAKAAANVGTAYFGGMQTENNTAICTSYIPTTTATVTRNGDVMSAAIGSVWNTAGGTIVSSFVDTIVNNGNPEVIFSCNNGTANERFLHYHTTGGSQGRWLSTSAGATVANFSTGNTTPSVPNKTAVAYANADYAGSVNGAAVLTAATAGALPVGVNTLLIGHELGSTQFCGGLRTIDYYNSRLPNATLQGLSA